MPPRAKDAGCRSELEEAGRLLPPDPEGALPTDTCVPTPWYRLWTSGFQNCCLPACADLQETSTLWNEQSQSSEAKSAISYPGLEPVGWPVSSADQTGLSGGWPVPSPPSSWDHQAGLGDALRAGRAEGAV